MPPTLEELSARYGSRYKWLVLGTVMIGAMAAILSSTIHTPPWIHICLDLAVTNHYKEPVCESIFH